MQKYKGQRQNRDTNQMQIQNTKIKSVGNRVCDCHVASLLAMTKRRKLLVMKETREAKNYELKTIYLQLMPAVEDVIANHCWCRKNEYLIHVGLIIGEVKTCLRQISQ